MLKNNKSFTIVLSVVLTFLSVALAVSAANWTAPAGSPPSNNADMPINVGGTPQTKSGPLSVSGQFSAGTITTTAFGNNVFQGNVGIGTSNPTSRLTVNGFIQTLSGGIRFPDGSVQATASTPAPTTCSAWWGGKWKAVDGKWVYIRPVAVIFDGAMDDFGPSAPGDSLYMFCVSPDGGYAGYTGMCLTKEPCPWG